MFKSIISHVGLSVVHNLIGAIISHKKGKNLQKKSQNTAILTLSNAAGGYLRQNGGTGETRVPT